MGSPARVLVTGFEPFAGAKLNSSQEVVSWLKTSEIDGVSFEILPVEYERSVERLISLIAEQEPKIIFSLGQAEGRAKVSFERIAINLDDASIADNAGEMRRNLPIKDGGAAGYMTKVPIRALVDDLREAGYPVEESLSAGAFVCNHLFYGAMDYLSKSAERRWMDFVHLPLIGEQGEDFPGKPTLDRQTQGRTIVAAIERARTFWKD